MTGCGLKRQYRDVATLQTLENLPGAADNCLKLVTGNCHGWKWLLSLVLPKERHNDAAAKIAAECSKSAANNPDKAKSPLRKRAKCLNIMVGRDRFELSTYGLRVPKYCNVSGLSVRRVLNINN